MKTSNRESSDARQKPIDTSHVRTEDLRWKSLYKAGAIAALIAGVLYVIEIIGVSATGPPTTTVIGWFTLLHNNQLRGLFDLFFLDMVVTALFVPMYLALYVALRRASPWAMALATILGFVSIAFYFASNRAFSMLSLSFQYSTATTDAQRSSLLMLAQGRSKEEAKLPVVS